MGAICEPHSGCHVLLETEHVVGRAFGCALRLDRGYVSARHAALRWTGCRWELRDYGSRNGTFLDGQRVPHGGMLPLRTGGAITFGKLEDEEWKFIDDSAPVVMAVPIGGGDPVLLDGDMLALPSNDDPRATIYGTVEGGWVLERPDDSQVLVTNMQTFEAAGAVWRFSCGQSIHTTSMVGAPTNAGIDDVRLVFSVSRDEEHVQLHATFAGRTLDMGTRAHNYLLLTLARRRLADAAEGEPETTCGWIYLEDLAHDPTMCGPQLNLDVYRIRKQFGALGFPIAASIVERRPRTRQLRIGANRISIAQL